MQPRITSIIDGAVLLLRKDHLRNWNPVREPAIAFMGQAVKNWQPGVPVLRRIAMRYIPESGIVIVEEDAFGLSEQSVFESLEQLDFDLRYTDPQPAKKHQNGLTQATQTNSL